MRIRSIKPEFWRSEDIAGLDIEVRFLFIGLWSYVDDNGVGRDLPKVIAADLFALEDDPRDAVARVSRGLSKLSEAGLIRRYEADGKAFLHITTWSKHQRIDKPAKPRYPLPTSGYGGSPETVATPSRESPENLAPGTGEQGIRGTEEQVLTPPADAVVAAPEGQPEKPTTQTLLAEWIEHCEGNPPKRMVGQVAKQLKELLDEGIPYDAVRAGLAAWHDRRLGVSVLPQIVHEVRQGPARRNGHAKPTPIQRALDIGEMGERLQAESDAHLAAIGAGPPEWVGA